MLGVSRKGHDVPMPAHRRRVALGAALASSLVGMTTVPATADDLVPAVSSDCGASQFCVWSGAFYSGNLKETTSTTAVSVGFSPVRSVWNRKSHAAVVYSGANGTGTETCHAPGDQFTSTSVVAGSTRVLTTTSC